MLKKISFRNYKSFKDLQELELRPITVLIGKNSSGKSSVAKLLTLIENSLTGKFPEPILLENNGIDLGAEFRDLINGRKRVGFLEIGMGDEYEELNIVIGSGTGTKDSPKIFEWKLKNKFGEFKKAEKDNFKGFIYQTQENAAIKSLCLPTDYIGPFRELPERQYSFPRINKIEKVGIRGKEAYQLIIQDGLTTEKEILDKVGLWFQQHFEGWGIRLNEDLAPFYQIELTRDNGRLNINLKDMGQGMSQVLPLAVRAFMDVSNEIAIIIEQPELHLHPAAHGDVAELFAESTKDKKRNYLIETHSQNFVLRLRRMVAEGRLSKDDILIYFVDFNEESGTSNLKKIMVDEFGEVDFWPENIFNESLDEALAIRKAQRKKNI